DGELVSISLQGKQFIKLMDEMKNIVDSGSKKNGIKIGFNLKKEEREILLKISKMGFDVNVDDLFKKLKKDKVISSKLSLNKLLKSLADINLLEVKGKDVSITELGKKTIINELLDEFNLA
ncbi:hypothetical protein KY334_06380, partial [Candidatus Woesearchaeota archaeon]|nr:hypothetical protein [Candidatus Woesearchaeota archaeon]